MLSMWFMTTTSGREKSMSLRALRNEFADRRSRSMTKGVRCASELSPQRKPMVEAQAMFFKAFEAAKGDVGIFEPCWGTIQITMHAKLGGKKRSEVAATIVLEGEGRAKEGWTVRPSVSSLICSHIDPTLFEALLLNDN